MNTAKYLSLLQSDQYQRKHYDLPLKVQEYQQDSFQSPRQPQNIANKYELAQNATSDKNYINIQQNYQEKQQDLSEHPNILDTLLSAQLTSIASSPQNYNIQECGVQPINYENSQNTHIQDNYRQESEKPQEIRIDLKEFMMQSEKRKSDKIICDQFFENQKLQFNLHEESCTPVSCSKENNERRQKFLRQYEKEQQEQQIILLQQQINSQQQQSQQMKRQMSRSILSNTTTMTTSTFDGLNIYNLSPKSNGINQNLKRINFMIRSDMLQDANIMLEELLLGDKQYLTNPILSQIYYQKGVISQKQELLDIAVVYFQKSMDYDPSNLKPAYSLAACENQRGNFSKALDDYTYALDAEVSAQNSRRLNHVSSLSRLRTSADFMRSFSNKDFNEKSYMKSPMPQILLQSQEMLSDTKSQSISRPTSGLAEGQNDYRKFFNKVPVAQSPLSQINIQNQYNMRDSLQSPISFRGEIKLQTPNENINQENSNQVIRLSDIEDDMKQQKIRDRQRSKENQNRVIQDLTQMIIRKKSPPQERQKQFSNINSQNSQMIKKLYLNPSKQIATQNDKIRQKRTVKSYKQMKENQYQEHFQKEIISSGEVSSITPMSTSQNNSRVSYNQNSNFNVSFKNMSSVSIMNQFSKVQKPSASTSLSKSSSSQQISQNTSRVQYKPTSPKVAAINQGVKVINYQINNKINKSGQKSQLVPKTQKTLNSKGISTHTQSQKQFTTVNKLSAKEPTQQKSTQDIQVISLKIDEFLRQRRRLNTVSPQPNRNTSNSQHREDRLKMFVSTQKNKYGVQSNTNSRPTSNIRNSSIGKQSVGNSQNIKNRALSNNSQNTKKLFSPLTIVQKRKQAEQKMITKTVDNRQPAQSNSKPLVLSQQSKKLLFSTQDGPMRSISPSQNYASPKNNQSKIFSPINKSQQVKEGSSKLFQRYLQMINKKQFSDCLNIVNQHISRSSYKQLSKQQAFFLRGLINFRLKHIEQALQDLEQSLVLNPNQPIAQLYFGICKFKERDYNCSLQQMTCYIKQYQEYVNKTTQNLQVFDFNQFTLQDYILALYYQAKCIYKLLEFREAINQCEIILDKIDYDDPNSLFQTFRTVLLIAKCYMKLKDYENVHKVILSVETSQAAIRNFKYYALKSQFYMNNDQMNKYHDINLALDSINEFQDAIQDFSQIQSERLIKSRNIFYEIASCYHNMQFYQEALYFYQCQMNSVLSQQRDEIVYQISQNQNNTALEYQNNQSLSTKEVSPNFHNINQTKIQQYQKQHQSFKPYSFQDMSNNSQQSMLRQTAEQSSINLIQSNQNQQNFQQLAELAIQKTITQSKDLTHQDTLSDLSQRQLILNISQNILQIYQIIGQEQLGEEYIANLITEWEQVMERFPDLKFKLKMIIQANLSQNQSSLRNSQDYSQTSSNNQNGQ